MVKGRQSPTCDGNSGFAVCANDRLTRLLRRQPLTAGFRSPLFHRRRQSDAFDRADFLESGAADDEARFAAFSSRLLLFRHVRNLSCFPSARDATSGAA